MSKSDRFAVTTQVDDPGRTLIVGQAHLGMAGVTATDYLVRHIDTTQVGHVAPEELPAFAPFEDGVPRHHSRLYSLDGTGLAVLVDELFVPVGLANPYVDAVLDWVQETEIRDIALLHGVPYPHGPDEHEVFHVATDGYRERHLADSPFQPLKGGVLDGVAGELVIRGLEESAPETGVFVTPTHPPGPDVDAAIKLLDAIETVYGIGVDETELEEYREDLQQYYEQLADRMAAMTAGEEELAGYDAPEDRMYM